MLRFCRDIKPDNIILEGCREGKEWINDDLMWSDGKNCQDAVKKGKFKAVLTDFGFARATTPEDFQNIKDDGVSAAIDECGNNHRSSEKDGRPFLRQKSRLVLRSRSAVGTRYFAAPEIERFVRKKESSALALTPCVSDYALISDAYAIGATLSEILTGVPPGQDIHHYVKANRKIAPKKESVISKLFRACFNQQNFPREIQLRHMEELPEPASDLITALMMPDVNDRLSVREAQNHEWIGGYDSLPHGDVPSHPGDSFIYLVNPVAHK